MKTEKNEQYIINLLLTSLKFCDTQTNGPRKNLYSIRSGLIYQSLGNVYLKAYISHVENSRKRKLLNLCRLYYEKSVKVFLCVEAPLELLRVQINRLELQKILFEGNNQLSIQQ